MRRKTFEISYVDAASYGKVCTMIYPELLSTEVFSGLGWVSFPPTLLSLMAMISSTVILCSILAKEVNIARSVS
jgi:hypothetical protein